MTSTPRPAAPYPGRHALQIRDVDQMTFREIRTIQQLSGINIFEADDVERELALIWWAARTQLDGEIYSRLKVDDVLDWKRDVAIPAPRDDDQTDVRQAAKDMAEEDPTGDDSPPFTGPSEPDPSYSSPSEQPA